MGFQSLVNPLTEQIYCKNVFALSGFKSSIQAQAHTIYILTTAFLTMKKKCNCIHNSLYAHFFFV